MHSQQGTKAGLWNMRLHPCLKGQGSASLFFSCVSGICAEGMGSVNRAQSCDTRGSPLCQMNERLKRWEDACLHSVIMCVLICHCLFPLFFIFFAPGPRKNLTSVSYFQISLLIKLQSKFILFALNSYSLQPSFISNLPTVTGKCALQQCLMMSE